MDKTDTWIEICDDDGKTVDAFHWPFCVVDGCSNRICRNISDLYCYPHSGGKTADKLIKKFNAPLKQTETA